MTANLLEAEPGTEVKVINDRTEEVEEARVTEKGIVREKDGSGAYSAGAYSLYDE